MRKIQILLLVAVASCLSSCLEKLPQDSVLEQDSMQTLTDADQIINGIYASFKGSGLYSGDLTLAPDIQADLVYAVDGFSNTYGKFWSWDFTPDDSNITNIYASLYGVIGRANFFLEYAPRVEESLHSEDDFATFDVLCGEAHFARALAYSELIRLFCPAYSEAIADDENSGVALSTSYSTAAVAKRATLRESYDLVLSDLAVAAELVTTNFNNSVYFTQGGVEALYARVYLHMEDWAKAEEYSSRVIDRTSTYALAAVDRTDTATGESQLSYMWTYDTSYEIIWKVGMTINSLGSELGRVFLGYNYVSYYPDYVPATWVLNSYPSGDGRASAYFGEAQTGYPHGLKWHLLTKYKGNAEFMQSNILFTHMPKPFRLAEQYLIRAEAYCRMGNYTKASTDLSAIVSNRVGSGTLTVNSDNWLEKISEERVRELFMEGFRLTDLKRWGMGFERTAQSNTVAPNNALKIEAGNYRFVWPIPQHEIEAPGSQMVQNAGY